jgi:hypothetical protein
VCLVAQRRGCRLLGVDGLAKMPDQGAVELANRGLVVSLEAAETQPSHETIARVAGLTGAEFAVDYVPAARTPTFLTKKAQAQASAHKRGAGAVVVAAKPHSARASR